MRLSLPVVLLLCVLAAAQNVQVRIPSLGYLEGVQGETYFTNRTIYKFLGIPYAEPPVGDNRFMRPKKKGPWEGVQNASNHGEVCPQLVVSHGSEDCLFLDVYSPQMNSSSKLPVLFFIHGGSFIEGTSRNVKPDFLLEHDVVLVAPQYRLGPVGFLTLNTTNKTGNAALYDVLMALQWVHDHINHFGGDPDKITIAGNSAGAAIASLLYVSPLTQDVFNQVMLFSGSALSIWAIDLDPVTSSRAIAYEVGCQNGTDDDLLLCLKEVENALDLTKAYKKILAMYRKKGVTGMGGSIPVIDNEILTELPELTLSNANFKGRPMLAMVTRDEGLFLVDSIITEYFESNNLTVDSVEIKHVIADALMSFTGIKDPTYTVASAISEIYFPEESTMYAGLVDFLGAVYFKGPALKLAKLNSLRNGKTFIGTLNYNPDGEGVDHMTEQKYLFLRGLTNFTDSNLDLAKKLTKLCANFIVKGVPTEEADKVDGVLWSPYSRSEETYLVIDKTLSLKQGFEQEFAVNNQKKETEHNISARSHLAHNLLYLLLALTAFLYIQYV
ncbi:neuroligin-4, Y-linked isoform X2 [Anabrus simplex]